MSHAPKIAIIHPDTLAAIGLKHMLQEVMPVVNVDLCRSVWEIPDAEIDDYIHYFSLLALEQAAHADGRNLPPSVTACNSEKHLSAREIEVMTLIVKGLINKEIADRLNISLTTTITHRRNLMEKLNIKSVSALTIYAVTHGYVDIGDI